MLIILTMAIAELATKPQTKAHNPYSSLDNDYIQWRVIKPSNNKESSLFKESYFFYPTFKATQPAFVLDESLNRNSNYEAVTAPRIMYMFMNKYKMKEKLNIDIQKPLSIDYKDEMSLNAYNTEVLSITFKLNPKIDKAEILDIISSNEEIVPMVCTKESMMNVPKCIEHEYKTDNESTAIVANFRIHPTKKDKHPFKLYVLVRVNDAHHVVVTIPGNYLVSKDTSFSFLSYQELFRLPKNLVSRKSIMLKNEGSKPIEVNEVQSVRKRVLEKTYDLKDDDFEYIGLSEDATQMAKEIGEKPFHVVPPNDERPIAEIKLENDRNEKKLGYEELDWVSLYNNVLKVTIDNRDYHYSITSLFHKPKKFFNHDFLNLGILASKNLYVGVSVYVNNRLGPAVLNDVKVMWENKDFEVNVAIPYKNKLALPYIDHKFKLLELYVRYTGKKKFSILRGKLKVELVLLNKKYEEHLSFFSIYSYDALILKKEDHMNLISDEKYNFNVRLFHRMNSTIYIDKIVVHKNKMIDSSKAKVMKNEVKYLRNNQPKSVFDISFYEYFFPSKRQKEDVFVSVYTMGTVINKRIRFYYENLLCTSFDPGRTMKPCHLTADNEFRNKYIKRGGKPVTIKWAMKNTSPIDQKITLMEASGYSSVFTYDITIFRYNLFKERVILKQFRMTKETLYELFVRIPKRSTAYFEIVIARSPPVRIIDMYFFNDMYLNFKTVRGYKFERIIKHGWIYGVVDFRDSFIKKTIIYPGTNEIFHVHVDNRYIIPVTVKEFKKTNDDPYITLIGFNSRLSPGPNNYAFSFVFSPNNNPFEGGYIESQSLKSNSTICLKDIDNHHNSSMTWKKLKEDGITTIKTQFKAKLSVGLTKYITFELTIVPPNFIPNPLFLGYNLLDGINKHHITIQNPFPDPVEFKLFLAPEDFLNIDSIDKEVINQIKLYEDSDLDSVICLSNKTMPTDIIKFFVKKIYSENLKFIKNPKTVSRQHGVCFQMPERQKDAEELYPKLNEYNNFFFTFTYFKTKEEFLKRKTVLISDIDEYTNYKRTLKPKRVWKDVFLFYFNLITNLIEKVSNKPQNQVKGKTDSNFKLNHIKNRLEYFESKELFINPKYLNQTFSLRGNESITLRNALTIHPLSKDKINFNKNEETILLLKNNITHIYTTPIKYVTVLDKLRVFSMRNLKLGKTLNWELKLVRYFTLKSLHSKDLQIRRPIFEEFMFVNQGESMIHIKRITIGNSEQNEPCLKLFDFHPKILRPVKIKKLEPNPEFLKISFLFTICRRLHSEIEVPIYLHSDQKTFEFKLRIYMTNYIVKYLGNEKEDNTVPLLMAFFIAIHILAWLRLLVKSCKKKNSIVLKHKNKMDVFLSDERLREKIDRYKTEIKIKKLENQPKVIQPKKNKTPKPELEERKKQDKSKKGSKLVPNEIYLDTFNYFDNLYPNSRGSRLQQNNSCISNETFEILFPKNSEGESDIDDMDAERKGLFNDSCSVVDDNIDGKHGVIGEESFSNYNNSMNVSFSSRNYNIRKKSETTSHDNFLTSLIIDQKMNRSSSDGEPSIAESEDKEGEKVNRNDDLDNIFGVGLLSKEKEKNSIYGRLIKRANTDSEKKPFEEKSVKRYTKPYVKSKKEKLKFE